MFKSFLCVVASLGFFLGMPGSSSAQVADTWFLGVSAEVTVDETFAVTWESRDPRSVDDQLSWIGIYEPGDRNNDPITWDRIPDDDQTGTYEARVRREGDYEVRLFRGATYEEIAEETFRASEIVPEGDWSLTLPEEIERGETLAIEWTTPDPRPDRSWIGVFEEGRSSRFPEDWERIPDDETDGTYEVTLDEEGTYEVRLFSGATYTDVAEERFSVVVVEPEGDWSLTLPDEIEEGESFAISWETPDPRPERSWVGVYREGASDSRPLSWEYLPDGEVSGDLEVTLDEAGAYDVRMFAGATYTEVADARVSVVEAEPEGDWSLTLPEEIERGETLAIEWTTPDPRPDRSWIGVFEEGRSSRFPEDWERIPDDETDGTYEVTLDEEGTYEVRLFSGATYTQVAEGVVAVVPAPATGGWSLDAPDTIDIGDTLSVDWEAPSPRTTADRNSWIGVYEEGASNNDPERWDRISNTETSGTYRVTINRSGTFEVRMFRGATYELVAKSTVTVELDLRVYSFLVYPDELTRGDRVFLDWSAPASDTTNSGVLNLFNNDWVGVFAMNERDDRPYAWRRIDAPSGTLSFEVNRAGMFEVRYFKGATYDRIFTSEAFVVRDPRDAAVCAGISLASVTNYPNDNEGPVIAFGDSLTEGVGAPAGQGYVDELEERLGIGVVNAGVSGDTTRDALARLEDDILSEDPSTVIVFLGGNDILRHIFEEARTNPLLFALRDDLEEAAENEGYEFEEVPLISRSETFDNIEEIVERIQDTGAEVILVGLDLAPLSRSVDDEYASVAARTGAVLVPDIYDGVFGRSQLMDDLVHPNSAGYDIFASRIAPRLECLVD